MDYSLLLAIENVGDSEIKDTDQQQSHEINSNKVKKSIVKMCKYYLLKIQQI